MAGFMAEFTSLCINGMSDDSLRKVIGQASEVLEGDALKSLTYIAVALELAFASTEKIRESASAALSKEMLGKDGEDE